MCSAPNLDVIRSIVRYSSISVCSVLDNSWSDFAPGSLQSGTITLLPNLRIGSSSSEDHIRRLGGSVSSVKVSDFEISTGQCYFKISNFNLMKSKPFAYHFNASEPKIHPPAHVGVLNPQNSYQINFSPDTSSPIPSQGNSPTLRMFEQQISSTTPWFHLFQYDCRRGHALVCPRR